MSCYDRKCVIIEAAMSKNGPYDSSHIGTEEKAVAGKVATSYLLSIYFDSSFSANTFSILPVLGPLSFSFLSLIHFFCIYGAILSLTLLPDNSVFFSLIKCVCVHVRARVHVHVHACVSA